MSFAFSWYLLCLMKLDDNALLATKKNYGDINMGCRKENKNVTVLNETCFLCHASHLSLPLISFVFATYLICLCHYLICLCHKSILSLPRISFVFSTYLVCLCHVSYLSSFFHAVNSLHFGVQES